MEEISSGKKVFISPLYSTLILGLPPSLMTSNGQCFMSDCTDESSNLRPIRRLAELFMENFEYLPKTVFWGFMATWFFAASPIRRSVSIVKRSRTKKYFSLAYFRGVMPVRLLENDLQTKTERGILYSENEGHDVARIFEKYVMHDLLGCNENRSVYFLVLSNTVCSSYYFMYKVKK
uniref:Uncharacterized protein n=1 Tax=Strigamia maritima TaxID=126957 RepID=T1IUX5_STRMM